jgi:hypothetical protein
MEAGTIGMWNVKEGDSFNAGDVIAEIETDKATMGFEAQDPGVVAKILIQAGQEVRCTLGSWIVDRFPLELRFAFARRCEYRFQLELLSLSSWTKQMM